VLSGTTGFIGGGLLGPKGIAIDKSGNAWIANAGGSSVVKLSPAGCSTLRERPASPPGASMRP
jgi:DNA-binding beta-propeller fold protein YncE